MVNELLRRLRVLLHREKFDRELEEEIRDHLLRRAADTGGDADAARRRFGNVTAVMEESRGLWSWRSAEQLLQDTRYAIRTMAGNLNNRLFTAAAVLSLSFGIGASTAIYSFLDAVMIRQLPVPSPGQLVVLNWRTHGKSAAVVRSHSGESYAEPGGGTTSPNYPYPAYELLRGGSSQVLSSLFGHTQATRINIVVDGEAEVAHGQYVTGDLFSGLGVPAVAGRVIGREDDRAGATPVVMLTFDYWRSRFGGNPAAVLGKSVQLNGAPFTIVGVAARDFFGVSPTVKPKIFIPMASVGLGLYPGELLGDANNYWIELMGRLKPGVTLPVAQAQLAGIFRNFVESTAANERERSDLPSLWLQEGASGTDYLRRQHSTMLWLLTVMAGLILLIACANVANLLLARAANRRREMAIRLGIGASRFRVVRQLLTESLILALASAAVGTCLAGLGIRLLLALLAKGDDGFTVEVGIDWRVLAFTLLIAIVTAIFFGLAPALRATRVALAPALKETRARGSHDGPRRWPFFATGHALIVAQIAFSLLLVAAASLFVRTLSNLHAVQLGFNAENLLIFNVNARKAGYQGPALRQFYSDLQNRLHTLPGVHGATTSDIPFVGGWSSRTNVLIPGMPPGGRPLTSLARVGAGFFETMEIPILAGRAIDQRDGEDSVKVAVVNQVFAEKYFGGIANATGRAFRLSSKSGDEITIVGVSRTARYHSLKQDVPPVTYLPWSQMPSSNSLRALHFEIRAAPGVDPLALAETVRRVVREASPLVPVEDLTTQSRRIDQTIGPERALARLCTGFGVVALLIACIGVYGMMAYAVARRTGEIGIRMALGATPGGIVWIVMREVVVLAGCGVAIGLAAAYRAGPLIESFLFEMKPNDPAALAFSVSALLVCSLIAGFLPACRASRIDPVDALRHD